jgi:hypothetical protein
VDGRSHERINANRQIQKALLQTVAHWVKNSWDTADVLIQRSFKCCGISNKRDGTEDDWIFNYDRLKQANEVVLSDKDDESGESGE